MTRRTVAIACTLLVTVVLTAVADDSNSQPPSAEPRLAPFEFHRVGAANPEEASKTLFRGVATRSPKHFVQHLLLGVCDGPIATLNKFAECQHVTEFHHGDDSFTVYDLHGPRKGINHKKPVRVVMTDHFDPEDKRVEALQFEMLSTYYAEAFMAVDVAAESYDGREYQTRIVVAQLGDGWYAMPRCHSAKSFYAIADAMSSTSQEGNHPLESKRNLQ